MVSKMKYGIYSVRDVLNGFGTPICDFNDKTSVRNFRTALGSGSCSNARDYDLFRIGEFDTDTGILIPEVSPVLVFRGIDCIQNEVTADG